jgi:hypothetical protein
MTMTERGSHGESVLVTLGWYVTVVAAVVVGYRQTDTGHSCDDATSWCFTPSDVASIGMILAVPVVLVATALSVLVSRPMVNSGVSAPVAGTVAAAVAGAVTSVIVGVLLAVAW